MLTSLAVASAGDIRAAVNALQFACLNGNRIHCIEKFFISDTNSVQK